MRSTTLPAELAAFASARSTSQPPLLVRRRARRVPDGESLDRLLVDAIEEPIGESDEGRDPHDRTNGDFGRAVWELENALLDRREPRFERRARRRPVDSLIFVDRIEV